MLQLFEIEDVFDIRDRGCVLVPGIPNSLAVSIRIGAAIVIEPPSGAALETEIVGLEMINRGRPIEHAPFSVPRHIRKDELPIGSRVFLRTKPLVQYGLVRVRRLVQSVDDYDGWRVNKTAPTVGDIGTVIDILIADGHAPKYVVERSSGDGITIWLSEFFSEEIEAEDELGI